MTSVAGKVAAAAFAGAATGCRSFTAIGVLALATPPRSTHQPDRALGKPGARAAVLTLTAGELVGDKLPQAPSRAEPPGLASRFAGAAGSGAVVSRRDGRADSRVDAACMGTAVAAGAGSIWLGLRWREWAGRRFGHDWVGAVVEDGVALGLAAVAARLVRPAG